MAHYIFVVNVRTDDKHIDAPDAEALRNEIINNLEYDSPDSGIERVSCREVRNGDTFADVVRRQAIQQREDIK